MVGQRGFRYYGWVIFFLAPSLIGLTLFTLIPIISSLGLTLFQWDMLTPPKFVGLANFGDLLHSDSFWQALLHTLTFIIGYIPLVLALGLGTALLLDRKLRGVAIFRTLFFIPVVSAWVAVALIWVWLLNPQYGLLNYLLGLVGIHGPAWLYDPRWAMPAIILTSVWKDIGFVMVMYLAGLQGIPEQFYEAAAIDGASGWQRFRHITVPLLSPTTFFALIISLINSFQVFDQVWIMTAGGPVGSTTVLVEQIVRQAFSYGNMGYAAALSWVLFLLVFGVTLLQTRMERQWVTYD
jgi:multiple sugar transport system permease protein